MSISFDTVRKTYKKQDYQDEVGIEVYDSFDGNNVFYPMDDAEELKGIAILKLISQGDMSCEETLMSIVEEIDDMNTDIFIDGERFEWESIKDIIEGMLKSIEDKDEDEEEN